MDIRCKTCLLRPLTAADATSLATHANDRDVWLSLRDRFPHPYSIQDAEQYIMAMASRPAQTSFGIVVAQEAVGSVSLMLGQDIERKSAEIGYWLGRAYWGRGIATDAVRAATLYAFDHLDLYRVFAVPFSRNPASSRVLEKVGYVREGVMRRSAIKDGQVIDQVLFAVCRGDLVNAGAV